MAVAGRHGNATALFMAGVAFELWGIWRNHPVTDAERVAAIMRAAKEAVPGDSDDAKIRRADILKSALFVASHRSGYVPGYLPWSGVHRPEHKFIKDTGSMPND